MLGDAYGTTQWLGPHDNWLLECETRRPSQGRRQRYVSYSPTGVSKTMTQYGGYFIKIHNTRIKELVREGWERPLLKGKAK